MQMGHLFSFSATYLQRQGAIGPVGEPIGAALLPALRSTATH